MGMKKKYILYLFITFITSIIIITTIENTSKYVTFKEAKKKIEGDIHVIGSLKRNKKGKITGIKSYKNKLSFSFIMVDNNGESEKIYYNEPMPVDFIKSEQIVIIGSYIKKNLSQKKY